MASESHEPRNILVTGGSGFIASHIVQTLVTHCPTYNVMPLNVNPPLAVMA